jgi:lipoate-protein ligase A
MILHLLPARTGGAAENMAVDFLLLQRYPEAAAARFRHYGWRVPAFTFGYSQKIAFVRAQLPSTGAFDLCRRPSGGGLVDHRQDWTYTLVIPRGHPLEAERAAQSYRVVHACLADALRAQGAAAELQSPAESGSSSTGLGADSPLLQGICFQRAEVHDVVNPENGEKIAGAAQKRNKRGLLFQGSVRRPAVSGSPDWDKIGDEFAARLAAALGAAPTPAPWPDLNEEEVGGLTEKYGSPEWMEAR